MAFIEKDCPAHVKIRGLRPYDTYELSWFNPRNGEWLADKLKLEVTDMGNITMPDYPDKMDWAFKLKKLNTDLPIRTRDMGLHGFGEIKERHIQTDSKA
jgi:hypothetical protein